MKPILLNNSLLCAVMETLAERILAFVCSRHLATIMPGHQVSTWAYADWRDLQATIRSLPAEWRKEALYFLRRAIRQSDRPKTGGFQGWLACVRDCDAASGNVTAYTPHTPGQFLR